MGMYRHVLVPLDGSAAAERAIEPALALASSVRAAVELVHVHDPAWLPHDGVPTVDPRFDQDRARTMREALDAAAAGLQTRSAVPITATMLHGTPVDALTEHVAATGVATSCPQPMTGCSTRTCSSIRAPDLQNVTVGRTHHLAPRPGCLTSRR